MRPSDETILWSVLYELSAALTFFLAAALLVLASIVGSQHLFLTGLAAMSGSISIIKA